jgi:oligopeptidase B
MKLTRAVPNYFRRFFSTRAVSPAQLEFISRENENFDGFLDRTKTLRTALYDEAVNMLIPEGMSPPELNKGYYYFQRYDEQGYLKFCRIPADSTGQVVPEVEASDLEEEMLGLQDVANQFSTNKFADVSAAKITIDNQMLGFVVDVRGDERWTLHFRDLLKREYCTMNIPLVRNFEWIDNPLVAGRFLYFTEMDPVTLRSVRVVRANLDKYPESREVVYELPTTNSASYVDLFKSKDGKCVFMSSSSKTQSEVYYVSSSDPKCVPRLVAAPIRGVEYYCEHADGFIYMVSNKDYTNFALYCMETQNPDSQAELMYHSVDMTISDLDMFRKGIVLYGNGFEGQPAVEVLRFKDSADPDTVPEDLSDYDAFGIADVVKIPFKGNYAIGKVEISVNGDFESDVCRFTFRNPKNPGTCLQFRFKDRKLEAVKSREFQRKAGIDMTVDRVGVPSMDGEVEIPLTLVMHADADPSRPRPCLVHVYGAYGQVLEPDFSPAVVSLLKRGWMVAFAHVRGGGERGPEWHKAACKENRWKSVVDLEACCRWLISEKFTTPSLLCAVGASAGGVVLGASLNVFGRSLIGGAAILRVPFVDLFETLKNPNLPLSSHETDEWGDVASPLGAPFVESISPADNLVTDVKDWYPPLMITSAQDDARVPYEGVVRFANKMRQIVPDMNMMVVKTCKSGEGGHFGSASSAGDYNDTCTELAFLLNQVRP